MSVRIACLLLAARFAIAAVPTPESYFGHKIGADRTVMDWDKVVGYFQTLAKGSDRIRGRIGKDRRRAPVHRGDDRGRSHAEKPGPVTPDPGAVCAT